MIIANTVEKRWKARCGEMIKTACLLTLTAVVMCCPRAVAQGVSDGVQLCIAVVVPSLFFMMATVVLLVQCGVAARAARWLAPVARSIFALPGEAASAMLLAMTGGYPAGAKAVCELYEQGVVTRDEAERMAQFCFCAGPAFILGVLGTATDSASAALLLAVQTITVPLMGAATRMLWRKNTDHTENRAIKREAKMKRTLSESIVYSVRQTASAMLMVCLFVTVFSAVRALLGHFGITEAIEQLCVRCGMSEGLAQAIVPMTLEVTGGCTAAVRAGLPAVAFAVGFGGIAVHMQVMAICAPLRLRYGRFFVMRLLQGAVCAALTYICMPMVSRGVEASASAVQAEKIIPALSATPMGSTALLVMCVMCALCMSDSILQARRV